jgi:hypothetical protein
MSISADRVGAAVVVQPAQPMSLGWVLRRALLGIAILFVTMGGVAWLTYASIDPDLDGRPSEAAKVTTPLQATEVRL